jgi:hypothetical protein
MGSGASPGLFFAGEEPARGRGRFSGSGGCRCSEFEGARKQVSVRFFERNDGGTRRVLAIARIDVEELGACALFLFSTGGGWRIFRRSGLGPRVVLLVVDTARRPRRAVSVDTECWRGGGSLQLSAAVAGHGGPGLRARLRHERSLANAGRRGFTSMALNYFDPPLLS